MKTLVFGANGMLGRDLLALSTEENPILGVDIEDGDITLLADVERLIETKKPDQVILAAAWTDVDGAETNKEACEAVNVRGPGNVGLACASQKIPLLLLSTDYVFSKPGPEAHGEEDAHEPINVYGQSKSDGEKALRESGAQWVVVRCSWLFGKQGKSFPATMLDLAKTKDHLNVVDDQIGAPTYTAHLAPALLEILKKGLRGNLQLAAEGQTSWFGLAQEVFKQAGIKIKLSPVPTTEFPRPAPRPRWSVLSLKRCHDADIRLPSWQQGVTDFLVN
jgi:dTDP-4-dehydrorhamnose reductase